MEPGRKKHVRILSMKSWLFNPGYLSFIMVYHNPHITRQYNPLYTLHKQFFSLPKWAWNFPSIFWVNIPKITSSNEHLVLFLLICSISSWNKNRRWDWTKGRSEKNNNTYSPNHDVINNKLSENKNPNWVGWKERVTTCFYKFEPLNP